MVDIILVVLLICIGSLPFCTYKLGKIAGKEKYFDKYFEEKHYSQELFLKCREKISKEDFKEIKDFHILHLIKKLEEEDGRTKRENKTTDCNKRQKRNHGTSTPKRTFRNR